MALHILRALHVCVCQPFALQVAKKKKGSKCFLPHICSHESVVAPLVWPSFRRSFCWCLYLGHTEAPKANTALLGDWRGQGSARRQRLGTLSVSWAELPSRSQNATERDLERKNASGGEEQGVLRQAPTPTAKSQALG